MKTEREFECPWCSGQMQSADEAIDVLACSTCSIVVELAADPVMAQVALAA